MCKNSVRSVKFDPEPQNENVIYSRDLVPLDEVTIIQSIISKNGRKCITLEARESLINHGVYLGYDGCATFPEIVLDEYGYYTLIFHRKKG